MRGADDVAIPLSMSSTLTRDPGGGVTGAVIVFRDLSEIESLRRSLLSSGRLAAIGELAAGIAHEVNNPVAFVRSDLNLLARRLHEISAYIDGAAKLESTDAIFARGGQRINHAREATDYVAQVVGDVRGFAHLGGRGQGGSEPVPLLEVALRLAALQRGSEVALVVSRAECDERIQYGQELKQILLSLLRTLIDSAESGARVEVSMGASANSLQVEISADPVAGDPDMLVSRFEAASAAADDTEESEVELAIAVGLVAELGGTIQVAALGAGRVEVQFELPLLAGEEG
jgi:signal transduction histidine kinase